MSEALDEIANYILPTYQHDGDGTAWVRLETARYLREVAATALSKVAGIDKTDKRQRHR